MSFKKVLQGEEAVGDGWAEDDPGGIQSKWKGVT